MGTLWCEGKNTDRERDNVKREQGRKQKKRKRRRRCRRIKDREGGRESEGERQRQSGRAREHQRDWSLLIFMISAPDNLWPKWRFDTNRPWRLTCSEAAQFRSYRASAAAKTRWTQTGDIQASKLPEKLRHGFSRTVRRTLEEGKKGKQWYSGLLAVSSSIWWKGKDRGKGEWIEGVKGSVQGRGGVIWPELNSCTWQC